MRRNAIALLLMCASAACATAAAIADDHAPRTAALVLAAAIAGAIPAALALAWCVRAALVRCGRCGELSAWYAGPLLSHAPPLVASAAALVALYHHPLANSTVHAVFRSCAITLAGWSLIRAVAHIALQALVVALALNRVPAKQAKLRRTLMILARLWQKSTTQGQDEQLTVGSVSGAPVPKLPRGDQEQPRPSIVDIFGAQGTGDTSPAAAVARKASKASKASKGPAGQGTPGQLSATSPTNGSVPASAKPPAPEAALPPQAPGSHTQQADGAAAADSADTKRAAPATKSSANAGSGAGAKPTSSSSEAVASGSGTSGAWGSGAGVGTTAEFVTAASGASTRMGTGTAHMVADWMHTAQSSLRKRMASQLLLLYQQSQGKAGGLTPDRVPDDPELLNEFLGVLGNAAKVKRRETALHSLFEYLRERGSAKTVVSPVSLHKMVCPEDASLLISQLGLYRRVATRDMFVSSTMEVLARHNRSRSSNSANQMRWAFRTTVDVVLLALVPTVFMLLMEVDPISVLLPVASSVVALSLVISPSVQRLLTCLEFVFLQHPFDVGDVVVIGGEPYRVDKITVTRTSLMSILSNARVYMSNYKLADTTIENSQRSNHAIVYVDIYVDPFVTAASVRELQLRLQAYMRTEGKDDWLQPAEPWIVSMDVRPEDGKLNLRVFGSTFVAWSARTEVLTVRTSLALAATRILKALGVAHDRAPYQLATSSRHDGGPFAGRGPSPAGMGGGVGGGVAAGVMRRPVSAPDMSVGASVPTWAASPAPATGLRDRDGLSESPTTLRTVTERSGRKQS